MFDKSYLKCANKTGLFLLVLFVICFFWYWIRPVDQDLHFRLLRMLFFGFNGMNFAGFVSGAVQSYIWGYVIAGIFRLTGCCGVKSA